MSKKTYQKACEKHARKSVLRCMQDDRYLLSYNANSIHFHRSCEWSNYASSLGTQNPRYIDGAN